MQKNEDKSAYQRALSTRFEVGSKSLSFFTSILSSIAFKKYWVEDELLSGLVHDTSHTLKKMLSHLFLANENFSARLHFLQHVS